MGYASNRDAAALTLTADRTRVLVAFHLPKDRLAEVYTPGGFFRPFPSEPAWRTVLEFEGDIMAGQRTPVLTRRPKPLLKIERRAWLRFPSEQDIICLPVAGRPVGEPEVAWMGKVRDVSPAGMGLSMSRRFEPGVELIIELSVNAKGILDLPVRVVHATPDKKGCWIIGCRFIFQLTEEERQTLLGLSLPQTATENSPGPARPAPPNQ
jgi:hypothetical protein